METLGRRLRVELGPWTIRPNAANSGSWVSGSKAASTLVMCVLALPCYWGDELFRQRETLMNYRILLIGGIVFAGLNSTTVLAQNTVGELLDAGGKKLSKDEVVAAIVGGNSSGPTRTGGQAQLNYKADGTFAGTIQSSQGKNGGMFGTWTVDDSGQACVEYTITIFGSQQGKSCAFFFRQADQYYVGDTDDRGSLLLRRTIKK
jgi:hypothetical protein